MSDKIRKYAQLRELIRVSLRIQNPEWVNSDGNSPICDFYDARFAQLLGLVPSQEDEPELPVSDRAEEAKEQPTGTLKSSGYYTLEPIGEAALGTGQKGWYLCDCFALRFLL